ncbi:hypothetical protein [Methylobacterium terricola]|uniref:hypothetical protein n=1 Tax=Methylobacterium terricola TaxID=2583531 RepID=UPI001486B2AD|nr:hypothetical protein [Methylobacterium terricola]
MKVALIVLWTLAAGVGLFLMVRARIIRATEALTREAERERIGAPPANGGEPDRPGGA